MGFAILADRELSIARLAARGVKRRIGACVWAPCSRNPLDDVVVCVRANDGRSDLRRALAVEPRSPTTERRQRGGGLQGSTHRNRSHHCHWVEALGGSHGFGWTADRGGCVLPSAWFAAARRFSVGTTHPHA